MGISDKIEAFITELLKNEQNEYVELGRNELAEIFNCVPSQINYVISTRFNPTHGYFVKSKRGGGGYLRIYRINTDDRLSEIYQELHSEIDFQTAKRIIIQLFDYGLIQEREANIMLSAVSEEVLPATLPESDSIRTKILINMIQVLRKD